MSSNLENALEAIKQFEKILSSKIIFDQLEIEVDKNDIIDVLSFLKEAEHFQFRQLSDVAGVDYPNKSPRV